MGALVIFAAQILRLTRLRRDFGVASTPKAFARHGG
jgi:hypothetical protein